MKIEIKAPAFPESVADGEVSLWHKQEGDFVQRDELLVEIETDKVVMEVVAPEAGRLDRIHVSEGSTIESEALLAEITPGEGEAAAPTAEASDAGQPTSTDAPMGPAARQLVEEHGLNPSAISGSGKGGRINKEDVLQHLAEKASLLLLRHLHQQPQRQVLRRHRQRPPTSRGLRVSELSDAFL